MARSLAALCAMARHRIAQGAGELVSNATAETTAVDHETLAGAEVLARWEHPTRGRLAPDQFLEFATEMNCVAEIDRQILTKSMSFVRAWREQDLFLPRLAVNVSSKRLNHPQLISSVEALGDDARIL